MPDRPRVIIVGGGFAGLEAARALARADADVTLVDRRNHHVFQPLLYQIATAAISPADIAAPIRHVLRKQRNCHVVLGTVTGVDAPAKRLRFDAGQGRGEASVAFDYLVLAAGATHSYFAHPEWEAVAPGLKTLEDATEIRRRILLAFESAEYEGDAERRRAALTFVIVGGGPTGVELAGAIKEIAAATIPADFRNIDTTSARVVLIEAGPRLLAAMPEDLARRAHSDLASMGVEVRVDARVTDINAEGVRVADEFIPARTVVWAAGVRASPIGASLGVPLDRSGRVIVGPDCSVPGHPAIFVVGDMALTHSSRTKQPVPGVAQGGLQTGRFVGRLIAREIAQPSTPRPSFEYRDLGSMATIGRARAVADIRGWRLTGFFAWLVWGGLHIMFIVNFRSRISVALQWFWNWMLFSRDARLILGPADLGIRTPRPADRITPADPQEANSTRESEIGVR
ncbi:MAG TPA: NAD(P)/FAD-dependent oxidoreductase [Phycisphaerales bacterium]